MTQDIVNQIKDFLAPVADKIGQGAQYGWSVVMRQMVIIGIADAIGALVALVVLIGAIVLVVEAGKKSDDTKKSYDDKKEAEEEAEIIKGVGLFIGLVALIAFCICSYVAVAHLANPGFYTLQYFIGLAHPR